MTRQKRTETIENILSEQFISDQTELLRALRKEGINATQATISRDLRFLHVKRHKLADGSTRYMLPTIVEPPTNELVAADDAPTTIVRISFNGPMAVIRTLPGYAQGVATELDRRAGGMLLGTIAGFDTVLVIPVEGETQAEVRGLLEQLLSDYHICSE